MLEGCISRKRISNGNNLLWITFQINKKKTRQTKKTTDLHYYITNDMVIVMALIFHFRIKHPAKTVKEMIPLAAPKCSQRYIHEVAESWSLLAA